MKRKIFTLLIVVIAIACSLTLTACGGVSQDVHEDYTNVSVTVPFDCKDIKATETIEGYFYLKDFQYPDKTLHIGEGEITQKNLFKGQTTIIKVYEMTTSYRDTGEYFKGTYTLTVTFYGVDGEEETKTIKVKR